jgi:hypothetical protein
MDWEKAVGAEKSNYIAGGNLERATITRGRAKLCLYREHDEFLGRLGQPERVRQFFDEEHEAIGLKLCPPEDESGWLVTRSKNRPWHSRSVSVEGLCARYKISCARKRVCKVVFVGEDMLVAHLNKDKLCAPSEYKWVEFVNKHSNRRAYESRVSILLTWYRGKITARKLTFNERIYDAIGRPKYIKRVCDQASNGIGFMAGSADCPYSREVKRADKQNGTAYYWVPIGETLALANFELEDSREFHEHVVENGRVSFALHKGSPVNRRGGRPRKVYDPKDIELYEKAIDERDARKGMINKKQLAGKLKISERSVTNLFKRLKVDYVKFRNAGRA